MENTIFTNSMLMRANQCTKLYYLNMHFPELKDDIKENQQSLFERRKIIAKLAHHLFPNGKYSSIDVTGSYKMSFLHTKDLLASETNTIFNACFNYNEMYSFIDILHRDNGKWNAFDIWDKSDSYSNIILTGTFQKYIVLKNGININDYFTILYTITKNMEGVIDLTYDIMSINSQITEYQENLCNKLTEIKRIEKKNIIPEIHQGNQCTNPKVCEFYNYCKFTDNSH